MLVTAAWGKPIGDRVAGMVEWAGNTFDTLG